MNHLAHKEAAPKLTRCFVLTVSDTRTDETDRGGKAIVDLLRQQGHEVSGKKIIQDDADKIREAIESHITQPEIDVLISTCGT